MEKIKELTRPILSWMFGIAFIIFTGMKIIPVEVFIAAASIIITYWFSERSKEKEYERYTKYK